MKILKVDGELRIDLRGDLAGILCVATNKKGPSLMDGPLAQVEMVAGKCNHLKLLFQAAG